MPVFRVDKRPAASLDCRGSLCPGPVVEVSKAIRGLALHEVLEVLATDPGFPADMQAFSTRTGHQLVGLERAPEGFRALIRRAR